ncbi:hypothetical protein [Porphyromonas gulae]|uniref:hypothetical protein n=1 Tax=Porphyromonas gulae TaxID=111105 RepID=UPI001E550549|nr:hypothetical protein [Porphyromonas gulae]
MLAPFFRKTRATIGAFSVRIGEGCRLQTKRSPPHAGHTPSEKSNKTHQIQAIYFTDIIKNRLVFWANFNKFVRII